MQFLITDRIECRDCCCARDEGESEPEPAARDQNWSFSANWIWRSRVDVSVMTPAEALKLSPEKTTGFGVSKFAWFKT